MTDNLRAGEDLLNRLRKIAYANNLLGGEMQAEGPVQAAPAPQTASASRAGTRP